VVNQIARLGQSPDLVASVMEFTSALIRAVKERRA
jgi:hypothetical protein